MNIRRTLQLAVLGSVALGGVALMPGDEVAQADSLNLSYVHFQQLYPKNSYREYSEWVGYEGVAGYKTAHGLNSNGAWETYEAFGTPSFNNQPRRVRYGVSSGASQQVRATVRCCKANKLSNCIEQFVGDRTYGWTAVGGYKDNSTACAADEVAMKVRLSQATLFCGNDGTQPYCQSL